jgi:hypothetical protein
MPSRLVGQVVTTCVCLVWELCRNLKKMFCGGDADCVQRELAEVRIPKTQGGFEGHWCMRLAQGNMYWLL